MRFTCRAESEGVMDGEAGDGESDEVLLIRTLIRIGLTR